MPSGIIDIIDSLYSGTLVTNATQIAGIIEPLVRSIAGIGALLYIFGSLALQIANNEEINFFPLLRPFILMLLIAIAPTIATAIDGLGNSIRTQITNKTTTINAKVDALQAKIAQKIDEKYDNLLNDPIAYEKYYGEPQADGAFLGSLPSDLKIGFDRASEKFKMDVFNIIQNIALMLVYLAEAILLVLSIGFRVVLRSVFPITLAIAIIPGFGISLVSWFAKYINYALMPAVAAIYSTITFSLLDAYVSTYDVSTSSADFGMSGTDPTSMGLAFTGLLLLSLIGYTQVPAMTNMIVEAGGNASMIRGLASKASSRLGAAGRIGTSGVVGAAKGAYVGGSIGAAGGGVGTVVGSVVGVAVGGVAKAAKSTYKETKSKL